MVKLKIPYHEVYAKQLRQYLERTQNLDSQAAFNSLFD